MYEIEKGIPIIAMNTSTGRPPKYPFHEMEVGDSFFIPSDAGRDARLVQASVMGTIRESRHRFTDQRKFCTRKVEGGVRVWRIS